MSKKDKLLGKSMNGSEIIKVKRNSKGLIVQIENIKGDILKNVWKKEKNCYVLHNQTFLDAEVLAHDFWS